jgi:hypothetical protein
MPNVETKKIRTSGIQRLGRALGELRRTQFFGPHQLQPQQDRAVGRGVDQERSRGTQSADHDAGDGRPGNPGQVEHRAVQGDGVRHLVPAHHLHREGLTGRVVDDCRQAQGESEHVDLPDPDRAGQGEDAEYERERAHYGLGHHEDLALGITIGDDATPEGEQQQRQELQAGSDAERGTAVVGELQHQPVLGDALHPAASV